MCRRDLEAGRRMIGGLLIFAPGGRRSGFVIHDCITTGRGTAYALICEVYASRTALD